MSFRASARDAGRAARKALAAGPATVFASFERSCYVETPAGIACLGGPDLGRGPLNVLIDDFRAAPVGAAFEIDLRGARTWTPAAPGPPGSFPVPEIPESIRKPGQAFVDWLAGKGTPDDCLIGLGPGLTPAGDDFVGGALIALRAFGHGGAADRIAAWALPLAESQTSRISRAHLACAAQGQGHETLHALLCALSRKAEERAAALAGLDRMGHSSGRDAAAGALRAIRLTGHLHYLSTGVGPIP